MDNLLTFKTAKMWTTQCLSGIYIYIERENREREREREREKKKKK